MASSDLRRLMQLKQSTTKKINHPLCKYNLDQLLCIICNKAIKSEAIWSAHLQSKKHKENVSLLKSKPAASTTVSTNSTQKRQILVLGRNSVNEAPSKKAKSELPADFFDKNLSSVSVKQSTNDESKTKNSQELQDFQSRTKGKGCSKVSTTPNKKIPLTYNEEKDNSIASKDKKKTDENVDQLPEGFFDDPRKDAKARNVEYKDPKEEEWEKFQKMIQEETKVAETIQEEEDEESEMHKDMRELNKMKSCLSRVENIKNLFHLSSQKKEGSKMGELIKISNDINDGSSESDEDIDIDFNWRAKMA